VPQEYPLSIRFRAEELYVDEGLNFEKVSEATRTLVRDLCGDEKGVSVSQLKRWSEEDRSNEGKSWPEKRDERQAALRQIEREKLLLKRELLDDARRTRDPQKVYAFARLEFPGREKLFFAYLGTMMIPYQVTLIPLFILMRYLGWIDSHLSLIVPACFSAFGTFLLRQFFLTIPKELEEAARIDGSSEFGIYSRIILPLAKPALATLGVFTFMWSWNDFMGPLIFINTMEKKTLTLGLASFQGMYTTDWTLLMAASVMALLPLIVIFLFAQRYFVEGITLSGIKG